MMRAAAALAIAAGLPFCLRLGLAIDPPSPPTGGFPDSGKECQWAATTQNAQYHIVNNVTERNGVLRAEALNDANGIFKVSISTRILG